VNCPYKVRQFNWFDHDLPTPPNERLDPDVTVRRRAASMAALVMRMELARPE
jgi:hypothetical protein